MVINELIRTELVNTEPWGIKWKHKKASGGHYSPGRDIIIYQLLGDNLLMVLRVNPNACSCKFPQKMHCFITFYFNVFSSFVLSLLLVLVAKLKAKSENTVYVS